VGEVQAPIDSRPAATFDVTDIDQSVPTIPTIMKNMQKPNMRKLARVSHLCQLALCEDTANSSSSPSEFGVELSLE